MNKSVGIYIEPKSPEFFDRVLNLNVNQMIYDLLKKYGLHDKNSDNFKNCPIVIQSFEIESVKFFKQVSNLPLIFLIRWSGTINLQEAAKYADGVGPDLDFIFYERIDDTLYCDGQKYANAVDFNEKVRKNRKTDSYEVLGKKVLKQKNNKFIDYAHSLGLVVHPWQMANDQHRISDDYILEYVKLIQLGVDAFFADFCDAGIFAMQHIANLSYNFGFDGSSPILKYIKK